MSDPGLAGRVAFITGAAHGQGRAMALALAADGADIVALDVGAELAYPSYAQGTTAELESLVGEVRALGRRAIPALAAVRDRDAVQRAGDEHWQALIRHHEDAYPASRPTPGDVCQAEAERLNELGLDELTLVETRVERTDGALRLVHVLETKPFEGYGA